MSHTPHLLTDEFPDHVEQMTALKQSNARFASLLDKYHEVNLAVHHAETDLHPKDDMTVTQMRKQRMALKDEIWGILSKEA